MRHSKMDLTLNVYADPRLLDFHAAVNELPSLDVKPKIPTEEKAIGTDDSKDAVVVAMIGQNQKDRSKVSLLRPTEEQKDASRLVSPRICPNETI